MSTSIRDAAQALLDACDEDARYGRLTCRLADLASSLRAAVAAPAPTDDERVAEHMELVRDAEKVWEQWGNCAQHDDELAAVAASGRALLATAQQDAEHAAMYRLVRGRPYLVMSDKEDGGVWRSDEELDAAIRAAMEQSK